MPLTMNLAIDGTLPDKPNRNEGVAITTTSTTITVQVNPNHPRILAFRPTVDCTITTWSEGGFSFPMDAGAALSLEVPVNTVFTVTAISTAGTMHVFVLR